MPPASEDARALRAAPPLTFRWDDWAARDTEPPSIVLRRWRAAVRAFAEAEDLDSFALMHPDSAANLHYADAPRTRRSIELSRAATGGPAVTATQPGGVTRR